MRAVIIKSVELKASPQGVPAEEVEGDVPVMRLDNGEEVEAYWCDRYIPEGTEGTAVFNPERHIWSFIPDDNS